MTTLLIAGLVLPLLLVYVVTILLFAMLPTLVNWSVMLLALVFVYKITQRHDRKIGGSVNQPVSKVRRHG